MNAVNCTALQHMFAVHGAALVAPYGGLSVRIEPVCFETVGSISEA